MAKAADVYFQVDPWKIVEEGFDPSYSRVSESIFSLANETMGVRGFFDEGGSVDSLRGGYVNGVYDLEFLPKSYQGIIDHSHFMIPAADWLRTRLTLGGETLDLGKSVFRDFRRELDMRTGTLTRSFLWQAADGKELQVSFLRFVDMTHRERGNQVITLRPLNFSGEIEVSLGVSFDVRHEGYDTCFWQEARLEAAENRLQAQAHTTYSGQEMFAGAAFSLPSGARAAARRENQSLSLDAVLPLTQGQETSLHRRAVLLYDGQQGEALWAAGEAALRAAEQVSLAESLQAQQDWWEAYWRTCDIEIEANPDGDAQLVAAEQQGIRYCSFQLAQTYNGGSMRHNIGAKGLTGEAYNGHAFWDTEACCLPFYLFTNPEAAKDLLLFRYNTLPQALERARMLDCQGACYPIATLNGQEACSLWQHASLQLQPSTAVAYGIWHYVQVTGDRDFLYRYGVEMLIQIARFLASRAAQGNATGKYGFFGVMGPDEFHMMVNNNAYTNYMGKRTLEFAAEALRDLEKDAPEACEALQAKVQLTAEEVAHWADIAENMYMPQTPEGLYEQHDGFFNLPHTDINAIPISEFPLYSHWSYDRIYRTDMIKQPDVLMFLYLYNSSFAEEIKRINYEFYQQRTIHESSLSPAIHSILAAELGKIEEATGFFGFATRLDLDNYNRNTREGLHITSIAMAWANIVYGFAGLRSDGDILRFAPVLPDRWAKLTFSILYQGRVIRVTLEGEGASFQLVQGEPLKIQIYGEDFLLTKTE
ncbi:MAG: family 65 glycosyl hydrolase [Clostridia bacterium]|nr:family 65 glycosyl hydrolase [Clostridia bacterium]